MVGKVEEGLGLLPKRSHSFPAPPAGHQVSEHMNLQGTFHIQTVPGKQQPAVS